MKKVIPPVRELLKPGHGEIICLIKPQFEAERNQVGKRGVVRDIEVHEQVVSDLVSFAVETGLFFKGISFSPIKGPEGNIEYLCYLSLKNGSSDMKQILPALQKAVQRSHVELG